MKILKRLLIIIISLIALLLIIALFVPRDFNSERSITINKPRQEVFDYIRYIRNQDNFGVWQLSDPDLKRTYEGTDGAVGFKYTWDSKKLGKGSQKIINIVEGERMDTELDFGFGDPAKASFITESLNPEQTKVTWGLSGRSPYPFNLMGLFFDVGDDFKKGLENLKAVLEK